jgi:hypothetical protein
MQRGLCATLTLAVTLTACGYAMAGTWTDDPGNWKRAFGTSLPPDARVVNSVYSRSPHFTYEAWFYFRVRMSKELVRKLTSDPELVKVDREKASISSCGTPPAWFAPKGASAYDVMAWRDNVAKQMLLIDPSGEEVFFSGCQL